MESRFLERLHEHEIARWDHDLVEAPQRAAAAVHEGGVHG